MSLLGDDEEEVKKKIKNILIKQTVLFAQTEAGKNSHKLKAEIRQMLYLLHKRNKINKSFYNNLIKSL